MNKHERREMPWIIAGSVLVLLLIAAGGRLWLAMKADIEQLTRCGQRGPQLAEHRDRRNGQTAG